MLLRRRPVLPPQSPFPQVLRGRFPDQMIRQIGPSIPVILDNRAAGSGSIECFLPVLRNRYVAESLLRSFLLLLSLHPLSGAASWTAEALPCFAVVWNLL
ncbi:MAG: hypothetical protein O3B13_20470 [Planctomycetota bacterium]|nr:hypothetical protein [Planctomycetota bacterium]